ncbi:MAG: cbb3-type cytochrome c oxidase subunit I [Planctomycetota bacterium]|jgi:cytochrome c oxidase cbb3-type subunit 1
MNAPLVAPERLPAVRAEIDRSCAIPCLAWFASSMFWLLTGTFLALIASFKMHSPEFLADSAWLTFGRVRPAHLNVVAFGWGCPAAFGVLLWLQCRLCRVKMVWPGMMIAACVFWNIGILVGTIAILAGKSLGIEWLEFPVYAAFLLFIGFALVAVWSMMTFAQRRQDHVYVSQWYMFAGLFWFPWLYVTVQILLIMMPVKGVTQAAITWWFGHNALGLWFTPIGLAAGYYFIPKVIGRPIYSYYLSLFGFWALALFYNWAGIHHLIAGPLPAWLVTVSIVGSMMMIIPVSAVAINHHMTMRGNFKLLAYSPTLRFIVFGAMAYTLTSIQGSLMSLRAYNEPTHFTHHTIGHAHLGLYAFFTMTMFGAMYYIVPRLTGREWGSSRLIRIHWWGTAGGVLLMFGVLTIGGFIQGFEMNQSSESFATSIDKHGLWEGTKAWFSGFQDRNGAVPFMEIVRGTVPWLIARSVSGVMMLVGHIAFFVLMVMNVHAWGRDRFGPTLFQRRDETYGRLMANELDEGIA